MKGRCTCGAVAYCLTARPLFVHCCHCRWCQRETGTAFALNALIETSALVIMHGATEPVATPSESGKGQTIHRCPECKVALWSHYAGAGPQFAFVRVGALDNPDACPPDIHIFAESKQPWVVLPSDTPKVPKYYRRSEHWPADSIRRRDAALGLTSR